MFFFDKERAIVLDNPVKIPAVIHFSDVYTEKDEFLNKLDEEAPYCTLCQRRTQPRIALGGEVIEYICYYCYIVTPK